MNGFQSAQLGPLYRKAVAELGTDDIVIVFIAGRSLRAHKRISFIEGCPAYRDRFSVPAKERWREEIERGEGGIAFFWLVTIDADGNGTSECQRIRQLSPGGDA